jgi:CheY-specific phosphatase CheX
MSAAIERQLSAVTAETLERIAFLFAAAAKPAPAADGAPLETVRVEFSGPFSGAVELGLSAAVLEELAANMLGAEEGSVPPVDDQHDALRELVNVVCGNLLPAVAGHEAEFRIHTPHIVSEREAVSADPAAEAVLALENGICRVRLKLAAGPPPAAGLSGRTTGGHAGR